MIPPATDALVPESIAAIITALDLRNHGFAIPAEIPDCAEIPRGSVQFGTKYVGPDESGGFRFEFEIQFTEPFRWIEGTYWLSSTK